MSRGAGTSGPAERAGAASASGRALRVEPAPSAADSGRGATASETRARGDSAKGARARARRRDSAERADSARVERRVHPALVCMGITFYLDGQRAGKYNLRMSMPKQMKKFRLERGLSQQQLGDMFGVSQEMIARIETGSHAMPSSLVPL